MNGELSFSLFIINQPPDEVSHSITQKKGTWSIFKLSLQFQDTTHRYIKNKQFIYFRYSFKYFFTKYPIKISKQLTRN